MQTWQRLARIFIRYILPAAVIVAVTVYFIRILSQPELRNVSYAFRVEWLFPCAILYLIAHTIWAVFWVMLLRNQGLHTSYATGWRAYFISQFGKYVPGKVWVILIRMVMLGANRRDKTIVGVTATYEALTSMAAGAMVGAILLPYLNVDLTGISGLSALNYILFTVACVPIGMGLLHWLSIRIARRKRGPDAPPIKNMNVFLLFWGLIQASVGWCILSVSLWMTMQAVMPEPVPFNQEVLLRLAAINAIAYIIGFVAFFLPGGVGAREYVLAFFLSRELVVSMPEPVAMGLAVVITLVLRLVWTIAEVIIAGLLYWFIPSSQRPHLADLKPEDKELVE